MGAILPDIGQRKDSVDNLHRVLCASDISLRTKGLLLITSFSFERAEWHYGLKDGTLMKIYEKLDNMVYLSDNDLEILTMILVDLELDK